MHKLSILTLLILLATSVASCQVSDSTSTLYVTLGQDSYFGFYTGVSGTHQLNKTTAFTVYANYWANPAYGNPVTGTDFWTEVGAGIDLSSRNGVIHVNPSVGVTYGKVLSGGEKGVLGDGIVPSVLTTISVGKIQTQIFSTYFKAMRAKGPVTTDFVWSWLNALYTVSPAFKAGILIDHFYMSRITGAAPETLYLWMGPLIQINFPHDAAFKISGGYDSVNKEYLKLNLTIAI